MFLGPTNTHCIEKKSTNSNGCISLQVDQLTDLLQKGMLIVQQAKGGMSEMRT